MTITPERLSEIAALRERARQWDGALTRVQHDDKRAALNGLIDRAIPELLAEVARISALETGLRDALEHWRYPPLTFDEKARKDEIWSLVYPLSDGVVVSSCASPDD